MNTMLQALNDLHTKDPAEIIGKLYTLFDKILWCEDRELAALYSTFELTKACYPNFDENQKKALEKIEGLILERMRVIIRERDEGCQQHDVQSKFFNSITGGKFPHPYIKDY